MALLVHLEEAHPNNLLLREYAIKRVRATNLVCSNLVRCTQDYLYIYIILEIGELIGAGIKPWQNVKLIIKVHSNENPAKLF